MGEVCWLLEQADFFTFLPEFFLRSLFLASLLKAQCDLKKFARLPFCENRAIALDNANEATWPMHSFHSFAHSFIHRSIPPFIRSSNLITLRSIRRWTPLVAGLDAIARSLQSQ